MKKTRLRIALEIYQFECAVQRERFLFQLIGYLNRITSRTVLEIAQLSGKSRANLSEIAFLNTSALTRMVYKLKTDTVLNDESSETERDLCAFGSTGGGGGAPAHI